MLWGWQIHLLLISRCLSQVRSAPTPWGTCSYIIRFDLCMDCFWAPRLFFVRMDFMRYYCWQVDAVDPKSRHKGKLDTETLLQSKGVPWTSIRPVYIYGPLNYNPVEEWFFQRLEAGRPIPVPAPGLQITQLGHVKVISLLLRIIHWCTLALTFSSVNHQGIYWYPNGF